MSTPLGDLVLPKKTQRSIHKIPERIKSLLCNMTKTKT